MSGSRPDEVSAADESRLLRRVLLATACRITNFVGSTSGTTALTHTTWYAGSASSLGAPALRSEP
jgi:hypothetical protein